MLAGRNIRVSMAKPIRTQRLVLRELVDSDAPQIARLAGDWDVARMTARIPFPYSEALARDWMSTIGNGEFVRSVMLDDELIGAVGFVMNDDRSAEIGYWIGRPWWGQGYATEAASALVRYCFADARLRRLTCCHFLDNAASRRVIEKLGFRASGLCSAWSEARQQEAAIQSYELNRPIKAVFWRRVA